MAGQDLCKAALKEISRVVVDNDELARGLLVGILSDGNILLEGLPGTGKTVLVKALADVSGCSFGRIQFTPDLLPTDLVGVTSYSPSKGFFAVKGPVFANFVFASGINRAPPKVQSALLEAMQERQVTIGKQTFPLPLPFFVMATQNPLESLGTYSLPDAQIDRFLFKLDAKYQDKATEKKILDNNSEYNPDVKLNAVLSPQKITGLQEDVKKVFMAPKVRDYIVRFVDATRNPKHYGISGAKFVQWGASPRATISLFIAAKANAFLAGKKFASPQDVKAVAHPVLRHRVILNYEGQAEGYTGDEFVDELLDKVPL
ncbi:ATPase [Candidatus Micrarchaeota archaeon CG1_02_55_22]|nr:MAG: ATPase [Candidatus Micrarchaeota archaeon CG1_02_55_22]